MKSWIHHCFPHSRACGRREWREEEQTRSVVIIIYCTCNFKGNNHEHPINRVVITYTLSHQLNMITLEQYDFIKTSFVIVLRRNKRITEYNVKSIMNKYLVERAKRGNCIVKRSPFPLCVCLSDDYGHTPLLIVMQFDINVENT